MPREERGVTSIETVAAGVVSILLVLGVVQLTLIWYARSVVRGAAFDGLRSAQTTTSQPEAIDSGSRAISLATVQRNAPWVDAVTTEVSTVASANGELIRFAVRGKMQGVFPGLVVHLHESAVGSQERLRPQGV